MTFNLPLENDILNKSSIYSKMTFNLPLEEDIINGVLIYSNDYIETVNIFNYHSLNTYLEGDIERYVHNKKDIYQCYFNKEGIIKKLPINKKGRYILEKLNFKVTDLILGNIIITGKLNKKGNHFSLTNEQIEKIFVLYEKYRE